MKQRSYKDFIPNRFPTPVLSPPLVPQPGAVVLTCGKAFDIAADGKFIARPRPGAKYLSATCRQ